MSHGTELENKPNSSRGTEQALIGIEKMDAASTATRSALVVCLVLAIASSCLLPFDRNLLLRSPVRLHRCAFSIWSPIFTLSFVAVFLPDGEIGFSSDVLVWGRAFHAISYLFCSGWVLASSRGWPRVAALALVLACGCAWTAAIFPQVFATGALRQESPTDVLSLVLVQSAFSLLAGWLLVAAAISVLIALAVGSGDTLGDIILGDEEEAPLGGGGVVEWLAVGMFPILSVACVVVSIALADPVLVVGPLVGASALKDRVAAQFLSILALGPALVTCVVLASTRAA